MALRIVDRDGNEVASCFYSEGNTPPIEVVEKWANEIVKAVNMHDRLVDTAAEMVACEEYEHCTGCPQGGSGCVLGISDPCQRMAGLLKEARGDQ